MKFKAPKCCKTFTKLKASYFSGYSFYIFQCEKCGKVIKLDSEDIEVEEETNGKN